jgi:HemY protein
MERLVTISRECYSGLLDFAIQGGGEAIQRIWQRMPKDLRADSDFIYRYALLLNEKANIDTAEELLREHINKHWDHRLVDLYGIVISSNPARQLQYAERWLKEHETDATLLLTLGRLCSKNSLWGKARDYLEVAVSIDHNRVDIYKELGSLYEKTGENEEAMNCYRKGMLLTKSGEIAPPAISTAQVVQ